MAISKLQPATSSTPASVSLTAAAANTFYSSGTVKLTPGIYRITNVSSRVSTLYFLSNGTSVGSASTSSGLVDVNLGSTVDSILYSVASGSNIIITIQYLSAPVSSSTVSGTLDTLTSGSGTYTQTGSAFVVAVGGGGGGAWASSGGAGGGGSGGVIGGFVTLSGSISYSVGAKGTKPTGSGQNGGTGGTTTFGSLTAGGGGGGNVDRTGGTAGSPNGGVGAYGSRNSQPTESISSPFSFVVSGTTGGGGYGTQGDSRGGGVGSGIGTGGTGGQGGTGEASTPASGYGGGGGAGVGSQGPSEATGGVIYVFRY